MRLRRVLVLLSASLLLVGAFVPVAQAKMRHERVANGVLLTTITRRGPRLKAWVVSIQPWARFSIRPVLATGELEGFERTSSMARRRNAVVAINGDYARPTGRPVNLFAQHGELIQTSLIWGRNFAMKSDGSRSYFGHPTVKVTLRRSTGDPIVVQKVNTGVGSRYNLQLFTSEGGRIARPPTGACSARLRPMSYPRFGEDGLEVVTRYFVKAVRCRHHRMMPRGGIVLSALRDGRKAELVRSLRGEDPLALSWSLGWQGVRESLGGNPTLIEDGRIVVGPAGDPFSMPNPRTGVASTPDGRILFAAVDGRRRGHSAGLSLIGFAKLFKEFGADWALNLDGGGSTTLAIRGRVINRPSDGAERPVSSALVLVPDWVSGKAGRASPAWRAPAPISEKKLFEKIEEDPGSTGGMAAALDGKAAGLPPALRRMARAFKASRR